MSQPRQDTARDEARPHRLCRRSSGGKRWGHPGGEFERTVGADAIVLTKADMDSRGGAAISIAHTIGKPLLFLGTGQAYEDIIPSNPTVIVDELLGGAA